MDSKIVLGEYINDILLSSQMTSLLSSKLNNKMISVN